ncbi:methyltransferase [Paracoccus liaowanqingii]|uniref:Methyltransferase n=1 Tax=Paracoccus liaowanqingii TaxID=2560053 RepID=A0A4P7HLR6_9RHOB|nr:methyltransferase [Paracoccus liaowanqingii]QBX34620.1 methyltransferase [Paracoccus liaowanqingii]
MSQNISTAVMQRRSEPHDSLDDFPTPPWATRALCHWLREATGRVLSDMSCREPAANRGHMFRPLREFFASVEAADIHDYGAGFPQQDYLFGPNPERVDWTITNPPFRLAEQFISRALATSELGVAVIVRSAFLEGIGRHDRLFCITPPTDILQFSERVVMHKGRLVPGGSTATAYCWLVWDKCSPPRCTIFDWIEPCRSKLERASDYQVAA